MRKFILFLLLGWVGVAGAAVDPQFLIQNYRAGHVSVDMTPAVAAKQYPAARVKWWEPFPRVHVIDIDPSTEPGVPPGLRLNLDRDQRSIFLIGISDRRYQTTKGIGIGSTFGALRKAHPHLNIRTEEGEMDRTIVAEILGEGISCVLQYDDATWKKMLEQPNRLDVPAGIIPDDKRIQSIGILPRPAAPPPSTDNGLE